MEGTSVAGNAEEDAYEEVAVHSGLARPHTVPLDGADGAAAYERSTVDEILERFGVVGPHTPWRDSNEHLDL